MDKFEIKGKVNTAICYAKVVEQDAVEQIHRMCDYEFTEGSQIRIMPDVHSGDENVYVDNVMIGCTASAEVSDNCSITDSWCTGRWGYFSDAISWYNNVKDEGVWDARYPAFKENVERIQEAVALWKAGDTEADIVKYTRAATDNTFVNNSNFAHDFYLCTLKIQYLAVIQLSMFRLYAA